MRISRIPLDLRIAIVYILFGAFWVIIGDHLLEFWIDDVSTFSRVGVFKGIFFVLLSAALIYSMAHRGLITLAQIKRDLHKTENAIVQSEARLSTIFRASPVPIAISRLSDNRFVEVNTAFQTLTGYYLEEIIDHTADELKIWDNPGERQLLIAQLLSEGAVRDFEFQLRQRSGRVYDMQLSAELVDLGEEPHVLTIAQDVTERKQAERQLRESEARFRTSLNSLMEGCQIIDFDWRHIYVNEAAARQLGVSPDQLLMRTMAEVYPGLEMTEMFQVMCHCMTERVQGHVETQLDLPDSSTRALELSIQPIPEGLFILSMDRTEYRLAEQALRAAEERYHAIFDGAVEGIFQSTPEGRFLTVNPALAKMWGYASPQELIESIRDIANEIYAEPGVREQYIKAMQKGDLHGFEYQVRCKDGETLWVSENSRAVRNSEGNIEYFEGYIQDITQSRRAADEVRRSEERYRGLFEDSPIALWEEDFSEVKSRLDAMREAGVSDFRRYFETHLQEVAELIESVKVLDVNKATLELLQVTDKAELMTSLKPVFEEDAHAGFITELVNIEAGLTHFHWEGINYTRGGQRLDVSMQWSAAPGHEQDLSHVLLSIIDITKNKRAELAIKESEARYRGLFEDSPIALREEDFSGIKRRLDDLRRNGVVDFHSYIRLHPEFVAECAALAKVTDVNNATLQQYGAESKEQLLKSLSEILNENAFEHFSHQLAEMAEGQTRFNWEGIDRRVDGSVINVQVSWSVAPGHEADLSKVLVSIMDITERKRAETALRESEHRYRILAEAAQEFIIIIGQNMKVEYLNGYGAQLLERRPDELIGMPLDQLFPHLITDAGRQKIEKLLNCSEPSYYENYVTIGKHEVWMGTRLVPIKDELGKTRALLGVARDITAQKQGEEAIKESEERFSSAFESAAIGMALVSPEGHWLKVNRALSEIVGYSKEELLKKTFQDITHPEDLEKDLIHLRKLLNKEIPHYQTEKRYIHKSGNVVWVALNVSLVRNSGGQPFQFVTQIQNVTERKYSEEKIVQQLKRITTLRDIDRLITSSLDLHLTLNRLLMHVTEQLQLDAAAILLFDHHALSLQYFTIQGFREKQIPNLRVPLGDGLAGKVAMERRTIHVDLSDLERRSSDYEPLLTKQSFVEYYGLPLISKGQLRGVMEVYHGSHFSPDSDWLDYLDALAGQAALAIDNIQMFEGLQRSNLELAHAYDATIEGWSRALDMRDKETEGHTQRVTEVTIALAREFGFSGEELANIRWGSLLHDIGKMGIPDAILLKTGSLTEEEWARMRQHPELAYELLSRIQYLRGALDIPHYHHEKWDGSGYPQGLKGEQIPLAARIFSVVDIWDALRSDRPYRPAWPLRKVLQHLRELSGTHLDPKVVQVFLERKIYEMKVVER